MDLFKRSTSLNNPFIRLGITKARSGGAIDWWASSLIKSALHVLKR